MFALPLALVKLIRIFDHYLILASHNLWYEFPQSE